MNLIEGLLELHLNTDAADLYEESQMKRHACE
jgi:hypothetical protein